jgi:hypothetical protein
MVADAVDIEPVSASNFPDNREKYREFCQFEGVLRIPAGVHRVESKAYGEIPYPTEHGM